MRAVAKHVHAALPVEDVLEGVMPPNGLPRELQVGRNWRKAVGVGRLHLDFIDRYFFFFLFSVEGGRGGGWGGGGIGVSRGGS